MGITFGRPPRPAFYNLGGRKNVQNCSRFLTTFDFDREYLWKGSEYRKSEEYFINYNPFHVGWKKFGELWSTNKNVLVAPIDPPKRSFFGRLHFGAWGAALQIDQALQAHTTTGTGSPKKIFNRENLKFGLKFSV